jgi:hypothetical protein
MKYTILPIFLSLTLIPYLIQAQSNKPGIFISRINLTNIYDPITKEVLKRRTPVNETIEFIVSTSQVKIYSVSDDGVDLISSIKINIGDKEGYYVGTLTSLGGIEMPVSLFFDFQTQVITIDFLNSHERNQFFIKNMNQLL